MNLPRCVGQLALRLMAGAFVALPLFAQLPKREIAPEREIVSLKINGVTDAIDIAELKRSIYTEPSKCRSIFLAPFCKFSNYRGFEDRHYFNRQEFKRDVLRIRVFYFRVGFRDVQVDTVVTQQGEREVAIEFNVREGPPTIVSNVNVTFDSSIIRPRQARALTVLKRNTPLNLFELDTTRIQFQNELWELGYADALIDTSSVVDPVAHTAAIQIHVVPNRITTVGDVVIGGTEAVSPNTVLNSLSFRPGDVFKRSATLESQRNLYESNLFKLAILEVPATFDSVKTVNVLLRESPLHESRTSIGFNTADYLQVEGRFSNYNFLGAARRFEISATAGNLAASTLNGRGIFKRQSSDSSITGDASDFLQPTWQTSIELRQPAFLQRPRSSLSVGAFAQRRAVPTVVIDRGYGGNVTFTRTLTSRVPASLNYRFEVTRVEAGGPYFCVNFGVCDTTTIAALRSHQRLSPLNASIQSDRTDDPLSPTRGYRARAEVEHASSLTVSDYKYTRLFGEATAYTHFGGKTSVVAGHLKAGFVRPIAGGTNSLQAVLHPRKRFYAGGSQSVRGFGENQLGPRILTLPRGYLTKSRTASGAPCDINSDAIRLCDPNFVTDTTGGPIDQDNPFTPRALGGTSLLEGSVEYRFPVRFIKDLGGAIFIDGAAVGERVLDPLGAGVRSLADLVRGTYAVTPGFGIRYYSSVGAIRIDVGFNPSRSEDLAVVTEITRNGKLEVIPLDLPKHFSPVGGSGGLAGTLSRFTLHLSIGQAY